MPKNLQIPNPAPQKLYVKVNLVSRNAKLDLTVHNTHKRRARQARHVMWAESVSGWRRLSWSNFATTTTAHFTVAFPSQSKSSELAIG